MAAPLTGHKLGDRYRILHPISRGGMGAVYEAEDEKLGRRVAVKVLLDELALDPTCMERFRREARAIAAVRHPSLVALHDLSLEGAPAFLVMELLDGESLSAVLGAEGVVAWPRAVRLAADVVDALGALHDAGIVHRDLKPANVLVVREEGRERAKLIDLGVAQLTTGDAYQRLTSSGALVGTPAFMSPEQLGGERVSPASDLWAVGVLLYTSISGQRPFAAATYAQLVGSIYAQEPTPLRTIAPDVPAALDALVGQLLRKDPSERPRTARATAMALRALVADVPVVTAVTQVARRPRSPASPPAVAPASSDRTRALARTTSFSAIGAGLAALGIVATCVVGIGLSLLFARPWEATSTEAPLPTGSTRSLSITHSGPDAIETQRAVAPVLDPILRACAVDLASRRLGATTVYTMRVGPDGRPERLTAQMSASPPEEAACFEAALLSAQWPPSTLVLREPIVILTIVL